MSSQGRKKPTFPIVVGELQNMETRTAAIEAAQMGGETTMGVPKYGDEKVKKVVAKIEALWNTVWGIFESLSDVDLKTAVRELKVMEDSGVLPDGVICALVARLQTETSTPEDNARQVVCDQIYRCAALKWAEA